jgi:hypothetical protein
MLINPETIANAITDAPGWALVGLTVPSESLREDAARELAAHLYRRLYAAPNAAVGQLRLPL